MPRKSSETAKAVAKPPVKEQTKTSAKSSTKTSVKAPTKAPTKASTKSSTKTSTKAPAKTSVKATSKAPAKSSTKAPVKDESSTQNEVVKRRVVVTRENMHEHFDALVSSIENEIQKIRESSDGKTKGVKYLRSLGKQVKTLKGQVARVLKQKQKTNRKNNSNSGFLKPVKLSDEMSKFTGWGENELKSRVDVTKYICKYIRDNNLQNPDDRRQILADDKLSSLLGYDSKSDEPLTYYRIQTYMKKHFS